jgi:hypothetical protein
MRFTPRIVDAPTSQSLSPTKGEFRMSLYKHHLIASGMGLGTVAQRLGHIEHLRRRHPNLMEVTTADLEKILTELKLAGHKPESRKSRVSSYRVFYGMGPVRWLYRGEPGGEAPADPHTS